MDPKVEIKLRLVTFTATYWGEENGKVITPKTTTIPQLSISCDELSAEMQAQLVAIIEPSFVEQFNLTKALEKKAGLNG